MSKSEYKGDRDAGRKENGGRTHRKTMGNTRPCEECGATDWTEDTTRGEVACNHCGLVTEQAMIDPGAEWTNHDSGEDRSRVGAPMTFRLADKGLNTSIAPSDLTSMGASRFGMSSRARREWRRRRVIDERAKTRQSRARNLIKANQMIRDKSGLPVSMQEECARLYRRLSDEGFVTGRSIAGVSAACCYLVARQENIPRQIPEFSEAFLVDEKELSRMIRHISRRFNLHTISEPSQYFDRFINELGLPPNTRMQIDHLWSAIRPHPDVWQGKKPMGVAAALIYKAAKESGHNRTQADVCSISNISEVTLRGLLKMIDGLLRKIGEASQN